ncbi:MAG TPA: hypothetical protein VKT72_03865 [Candidatus Baltobacteraceae bacterium]|nr:hypothetical protein [Candidatus Baltobacteraceae bacterium]
MVPTFLRTSVAIAMAAAIGTAPALADPTGMFGAAVSGANTAIKNAESAQPQVIHLPDGTVAQVPPVTQSSQVGPQAGGVALPTGFTYTLDASIAHSLGETGKFGDKWLPGGMDAVLGYGFGPHSRLVANYYELQHYPVGFNSGQVPLYLPSGFPPIPGVNPSCVNLSGSSSSATCPGIPKPIDVTTKDKFALFMFEQLIDLGTIGHGASAHTVPIVITPTYVSRWSTIGGSNDGTDVVPFVDSNGVPHTNINTRTAQVYSLAVTLPFLKTPKMFGTFTVAPSWLVHTAGLNQQNHTQLYQILYLEYTPTKDMRIFFEPQSSRDYLPTDPYAQHLAAYFLGISQRVAKYGFIQVVLNSGGPTNYSPYGVKQLNCIQLPCSANTLPMVGGLKASQVQIQFGIGSPSVIQF